jgi:lactate dehydrogenase-like 2-hydroxyacid dehydrogenase
MGRIGVAVARRAHFGFGMPVVYHDTVDFVPPGSIRST